MSLESWLSRIRENREIKRTEKLRKKYEFLINEIYTSQDRTVTKVIDQETEILNIKSGQLESRIMHSLASLETQLNDRSVSIIEHTSSLQSEQQVSKNEIKVLLDAIIKKLETVEVSNRGFQEKSKELLEGCSTTIRDKIVKSEEKIISIMGEKSSCTQREIECVSASMGEQFDEIYRVLKSIISKIEAVQNNTNEVTEKCNEVVEDKSNNILLSIDEVKTLMKIVAVNNLLDEI